MEACPVCGEEVIEFEYDPVGDLIYVKFLCVTEDCEHYESWGHAKFQLVKE